MYAQAEITMASQVLAHRYHAPEQHGRRSWKGITAERQRFFGNRPHILVILSIPYVSEMG